jgi:hypothetical protein
LYNSSTNYDTGYSTSPKTAALSALSSSSTDDSTTFNRSSSNTAAFITSSTGATEGDSYVSSGLTGAIADNSGGNSAVLDDISGNRNSEATTTVSTLLNQNQSQDQEHDGLKSIIGVKFPPTTDSSRELLSMAVHSNFNANSNANANANSNANANANESANSRPSTPTGRPNSMSARPCTPTRGTSTVNKLGEFLRQHPPKRENSSRVLVETGTATATSKTGVVQAPKTAPLVVAELNRCSTDDSTAVKKGSDSGSGTAAFIAPPKDISVDPHAGTAPVENSRGDCDTVGVSSSAAGSGSSGGSGSLGASTTPSPPPFPSDYVVHSSNTNTNTNVNLNVKYANVNSRPSTPTGRPISMPARPCTPTRGTATVNKLGEFLRQHPPKRENSSGNVLSSAPAATASATAPAAISPITTTSTSAASLSYDGPTSPNKTAARVALSSNDEDSGSGTSTSTTTTSNSPSTTTAATNTAHEVMKSAVGYFTNHSSK